MWDVQELFKRHGQELSRFLRRRVSSPDIAADLTQDLFLRLLTAAPAADAQNHQAYLFAAARNLAIDYNKRARLVTFVNDPDVLLAIPDDVPNAERALLSRQELAIIAATLAEFPQVQREVFLLSRLEGLTYQAIGRRLGIPQQTAFSHMVRMLTRMQLRLGSA